MSISLRSEICRSPKNQGKHFKSSLSCLRKLPRPVGAFPLILRHECENCNTTQEDPSQSATSIVHSFCFLHWPVLYKWFQWDLLLAPQGAIIFYGNGGCLQWAIIDFTASSLGTLINFGHHPLGTQKNFAPPTAPSDKKACPLLDHAKKSACPLLDPPPQKKFALPLRVPQKIQPPSSYKDALKSDPPMVIP